MKKIIILLMFYGILIAQQSNLALHIPEKYKPTGLLIFLDDSEDIVDAVSSEILTALDKKVGPFIVSGHIARNIFSQYSNIASFNTSSDPSILYEAYWKLKLNNSYQDIKNYYLKAIKFKEDEWIIRKISDDLYLFVFKSSQSEQEIGLNLSDMSIVSIDKIVSVKRDTQQDYFANNLEKIFAKDSKCFWTIYMCGHGSAGKQICGISIEAFKNVLAFFNNKIKTRLFIYTSCFSGGINAHILFKDMRYNFAIISQSNTDAPTSKTAVRISPGFILGVEEAPDKFFKLLGSDYSYKEITETFFKIIPSNLFFPPWGNLPLIRLPNDNKFTILANLDKEPNQQEIVAIDEKSPNPFVFYNDIYQAILLYVKDIPYVLNINSHKMDAIVSMMPGEASHTIQEINSNTVSLNSVLGWFISVDQLIAKKFFYISKIEAQDQKISDVIIYLDSIEPSAWQKQEGAVTQFNATIYYKNSAGNIMRLSVTSGTSWNLGAQLSKGAPMVVSHAQEQEYNFLRAKATGEIVILAGMQFSSLELFNAFFQKKYERKYPSSIIEFIKCPKDYIYSILKNFFNLLEKESFLWIKSVTGKYMKYSEYSGSGMAEDISEAVSNGSEMVVTDVLIYNAGNFHDSRIYYTFNNKFYNSMTPTEPMTEGDKQHYQKYIKKYGKKNFAADSADNISLVNLTVSLSALT